jgi:hypothetical protein
MIRRGCGSRIVVDHGLCHSSRGTHRSLASSSEWRVSRRHPTLGSDPHSSLTFRLNEARTGS